MIHNNLYLYELKKFENLPTKLPRSEYLRILFAPIWLSAREYNRKAVYRKYISFSRRKDDDLLRIQNLYRLSDAQTISELAEAFSLLEPAENLDFELQVVTDRCQLLELKQKLETVNFRSLKGILFHPLTRWSLAQSIRLMNCRSYPLESFIQMGMRRYLNEKWGSREDFLKDFETFAKSEKSLSLIKGAGI